MGGEEMCKKYLGHLPEHDPLYNYLKYEIQPQISGYSGHLTYRVFELNASNDVYLYEEKHCGTKVIGKFFLSARIRDHEVAARRMEREYHNLCMMRDCGFSRCPNYIARPLGRNLSLNRLLVVEFCEGELMSNVILRAIHTGDDALLYSKLTALAYFLSRFHNCTAGDGRVDFNDACSYMDSLTGRLSALHGISREEAGELCRLRDRWREQPKMWEDRQVWVHGDATPDNFLFGDGLCVRTFDLERTRRADRLFDTGRIAGELMHFFLQNTGNKYAAEPIIGHFLWEYSCHFPDREQTFRSITRRVPFYMGITLLRIARNDWLCAGYKRQLVQEAKQCLRRWTI